MSKKKNAPVSISQEDNAQAQQILAQYHQIANDLHMSTNQKQAEDLLANINNMPEAAQMALLKALSKEQHTDAADVLIAINELSQLKSVRKEARRSLIRLEEARIYPVWSAPINRAPVIQFQVSTDNLRFWKGVVTDTLGAGEVQVVLCWEREDNDTEVRVLGFLLEFWHDGVKDFFTYVRSKRSIESLIATTMPGLAQKDCSLAEGRRLLRRALAVNKRHGTVPYKDYRLNASLVEQLVLQAPGFDTDLDTDLNADFDADLDADFDEDEDEDEESEGSLVKPGLEPQEVVTDFVEAWHDSDYGLAYQLLTSDSSLREGLSSDEWSERREEWEDEANPDHLQPNFIHEREPQKSRLWLPNLFSASRSSTQKEIEIGWSLIFDDTPPPSNAMSAPLDIRSLPLGETLPELPQATAVYEETKRHWFWTSYTLVQEDGEWRIQSMVDEGKNILDLPAAELQRRMEEHNERIEEITQKHQPTDPDAQQYSDEIHWRLMQTAFYTDALVKHLPLDRTLYEEAAARMVMFGELERSLLYLDPLAHRFPERRGENLRQLAAVQIQLAEKYFDEADDDRAEHLQELAEATIRESLEVDDHLLGHLLLGELLMGMDDRLDDAEEQLHQAGLLASTPSEEAHVETHLAEIAMKREDYEQTLSHYQRVTELDPTSAEAWVGIAGAYSKLENVVEAEKNYRHAVELEPDNLDAWLDFSKMYLDNLEAEKASEVLEEALRLNPDSAVLYAYMGSTSLEQGDYDQAESYLDEAERLDPELEALALFRQVLKLTRPKSMPKLKPISSPRLLSGPKSVSTPKSGSRPKRLGRHKKKRR